MTDLTTTTSEPSTSMLVDSEAEKPVEPSESSPEQTKTVEPTETKSEDVVIELGGVPESEGIGTVTYTYPKMAENTDFETFRKTDPTWKKIVEWYNNAKYMNMPVEEGEPEKQGKDKKHDKEKKKKKKKRTKEEVDKSEWRERFVLQHWPRDQKGPPLKGHSGGKSTSNGQPLWGATLYDFYMVERLPGLANLRTITTGSRMADWCKSIGEVNHAKQQIEQAEMEERPKQLPPYPIWKLVEEMEVLARNKAHGKELKWKGKLSVTEEDEGSPFNYADHPAPWPLRPFSAFIPRLQSYIPFESLPEILIVHDPWNLLETPRLSDVEYSPVHEAGTAGKAEYKWKNVLKDRTRRYRLYLSASAEEIRKRDGIDRSTKSTTWQNPKCREAHMYLSPYRRVGQGHHSLLYQVELEVPRELVVQPRQCHTYTEEACAKSETYQKAVRDGDSVLEYAMLAKLAKFQLPPYCQHMDKGPVPATARVSVIAKLALNSSSGEHERHLRLESSNYQRFPMSFFQHFNGYNIIAPIHEPTPVGAVAPQFYGFYEPEESVGQKKFLSPILLMEHCGSQVDVDNLGYDDKRECFSLLLRLHHAGYVHNSVATRNFLVQSGPLQAHPLKRSMLHPRFRLADFGRTVQDSKNFSGSVTERSAANDQLNLGMY